MAAPPAAAVPRTREARLVAAFAGGCALLAFAGAYVVGPAGLALPLALLAGLALLRWPAGTFFGTVAVVVLIEGKEFGLTAGAQHFYDNLLKGVTAPDLLMLAAVAAVAIRLLRDDEPIRLPPLPVGVLLVLVPLAIAAGLLVGRAHGAGLSDELIQARSMAYVALLPWIVVNLGLDERRMRRVLLGAAVLAVVKAVLGLAAVATGRGTKLTGESTLTYFEPAANWLMMLLVLVVAAAVLLRARPPRWLLAAAPLVLAALLLSYRRSFWIGLALALLVLLGLGLSPTGRRLIVPIAGLVAVAIWSLGTVALQSDSPIGERVQSLSSSEISSKPDDRYRFDERANVLAELRAHPVGGLGLFVPWQAAARPLPVEVDPDHQYVHFAALYWWLKLGILGLLAYLATLAAGAALSWQVWRRSEPPLLRAVGLGSLCAFVGLAAIESTGSFTGVDARFTFLLGAQLGVLAVLARTAGRAA